MGKEDGDFSCENFKSGLPRRQMPRRAPAVHGKRAGGAENQSQVSLVLPLPVLFLTHVMKG